MTPRLTSLLAALAIAGFATGAQAQEKLKIGMLATLSGRPRCSASTCATASSSA